MTTLFYRIVYLGYYLKTTDYPKLWTQLAEARRTSGRTSAGLLFDAVISSVRYNISLLEYFYFDFHLKRDTAYRKAYAGTGFMYETMLKFNPKPTRHYLADKLVFLQEYRPFILHQHASLTQLEADKNLGDQLLSQTKDKIVLKDSHGQCGRGIEILNAQDLDGDALLRRLIESKNDMVEEFVVQHRDLMRLSPSGLNTLRVITQLDGKGGVDILGARLRISVDSPVDNLAAGNIAAPVDLETGTINSPGVYSDITKPDEHTHPITKEPIVGFKVPFWNESLELARKAALHNTSNRSIGWDIAITDEGPGLIEGNHDWCKLLWQLPVRQGLKPVLEEYKVKLGG